MFLNGGYSTRRPYGRFVVTNRTSLLVVFATYYIFSFRFSYVILHYLDFNFFAVQMALNNKLLID